MVALKFIDTSGLFPPDYFLALIHLSGDSSVLKNESDSEILDVLAGTPQKKLLVINPGTVDSENAMLRFCNRIAAISKTSGNKSLIAVKDPDCGFIDWFLGIYKDCDLNDAVFKTRSLYARIICETGLSIAHELVYPQLLPYFEDMIGCLAVDDDYTESGMPLTGNAIKKDSIENCVFIECGDDFGEIERIVISASK